MSSPPNVGQSPSRAEHVIPRNSNLNAASTSAHDHDTPSQLRSTPDRNPLLTRSATRFTSDASEQAMPGAFHENRAIDDASSITLQDDLRLHEFFDFDKYEQTLPATIVPPLLQGPSDVSPSRSSLDGEGVPREADEGSVDPGDVPRYSATQKEEWGAQTDNDGTPACWDTSSPSPQFHVDGIYNTIEDWVVHTKPILQEYANRQTSLPLERRLEVTMNEPPKFILGALELLANRDQKGRSQQLGPQLIENFVDIDCWAKEYLRCQHSTQVDSDVSALLTIVINNFYEGVVQLIDRLVEFSLENMRCRGRSSLGIEDFAFGFDFRMSQDLPFYVETSSKIRERARPTTYPVETPVPVVTHSGRHVKPTERAQAASEQARANTSGIRNKGKKSSQPKDAEAAKSSSSQRIVEQTPTPSHAGRPAEAHDPLKATSEHTKHRPTRPSNLGLPPILPISSSTPGTISYPGDSSKPSTSPTGSPKISGSGGPKPVVDSSPRLTIKLPALGLPASMVVPKLTLGKTSSSTSQTDSSVDAAETTNKERGAPSPGVVRPRGPHNERDRSRGRGRERGSTSSTTNGENSTARPHAVDNSTATGDDDPSTSQSGPTNKLLPSPADPGHPQRKKRKLDDCEDEQGLRLQV